MASIYEKDKACAAPRCTNTMTGSDLPRFCAEHNDLNKLERPRFPIEAALKPECDSIRADLLAIEKRCRALGEHLSTVFRDTGAGLDDIPSFQERTAHSILAVRHIEDARMRIGKVLQHARDGVSCYEK